MQNTVTLAAAPTVGCEVTVKLPSPMAPNPTPSMNLSKRLAFTPPAGMPRISGHRIGAILAGMTMLLPCVFAQTTAPRKDDVLYLNPFVVQSQTADRYREDESTTGSIIAMKRSDLPMDISIIGANLIGDMGLFNADDIGTVLPGVSSDQNANTTGGGNNTTYLLRAFSSAPRWNGFAPGGRLYDMSDVERIEVIKGPNSVLYGQTNPGGIINYVSKRPLFENRDTLSASVGSYNTNREQIDVTGPIGSGRKLAYRVPASFVESGSDINYSRSRRTMVAPSVLWRLGHATELFVETEYLKQTDSLVDSTAWSKTDANGNLVTDYNKGGLGRAFTERGPNTYSTNKQYSTLAELTTQVGEDISLRAAYTYNSRDTVIRNTTGTGNVLKGATYSGFMSYPYNRIRGYKLDALYKKTIGGVQTRTLLGYEYNYNLFASTRYNAKAKIPALPNPLTGGTVTDASYVWNAGDPYSDPANFTLQAGNPTQNYTEWTNLRLSETLHMLNERLVFLGGVAAGSVKRVVNGNQSVPKIKATTYMAGLTYRMVPQVNAFVNMSTSFAPVFATDINNQPLSPSSGRGVEVGFKFHTEENRLFATLTYFDLTNSNLPRQVAASESSTGQAYSVSSGKEEAKGVELEAQWNVSKQFKVLLSLIKFDGKLVSPSNGIGTPGQRIPRSPQTAGMATLVYNFADGGALHGLRFGLTGSYKGSAPINANYSSPTLVSDAFFIVNGFVRYRLPTKLNVELFLNVNNALDEKYIQPNNSYGALRSFNVGTQLRF